MYRYCCKVPTSYVVLNDYANTIITSDDAVDPCKLFNSWTVNSIPMLLLTARIFHWNNLIQLHGRWSTYHSSNERWTGSWEQWTNTCRYLEAYRHSLRQRELFFSIPRLRSFIRIKSITFLDNLAFPKFLAVNIICYEVADVPT